MTIEALPPNVKTLFLSENQLTSLPNLPDSLITLQAFDNQLSSLPDMTGLKNLDQLNLATNKLNVFPDMSGLNTVTWINFANNPLIEIPDMPTMANLELIGFWRCGIETIGDFSALKSLKSLYLHENHLTDLPDFSGLPLEILYVNKNYLHFADIEPLLDLNINKLKYSQQTVPDTEGDFLKFKGESINFTIPEIEGTDVHYQWVKDGQDVSEAIDRILQIDNLTFDDTGTYQCEITSPLVPNLTIRSGNMRLDIITQSTTILQADSLALVALYNSTNGDNWAMNNNWLSGKADSWYGVELENYSVISLHLSNNNLTGAIPGDLSSLLNLKQCDFSDNELVDLANLSAMIWLESFDVSNNQMTFEDLQVNRNIPGIQYAPQAELGEEKEIIVEKGDQFTITVPVGGTTNAYYRWYINSDFFLYTGTENELVINHVDEMLDGIYHCEISNPYLPELILKSRPINVVIDLGIEPDSLALVALYNACGGVNWIMNTNWLNGLVDSWYGITVTDNRVTVLNLSFNNLTGGIPMELANLDKVTSIELHGNEIVDLPDLTNLSSITKLTVYHNQLTFEDLEPNMNIGGFEYSPQAMVGEEEQKTVTEGDPVSFSIEVTGSANVYQWIKDGAALPNANDSKYEIMATVLEDAGVFSCEITNTLVTGLTLSSYPVHLNVDIDLTPDSLALVALYDACGGNNWTMNTNWKNGSVKSWYGVTLTNNRVTALDLSNNNLAGTVPQELSNLDKISSIQLHGNLIVNLPDLTGLSSITKLTVYDNQLTFEDLEVNSEIPGIEYAPQAKVGENMEVNLKEEEPLQLSIDVEGTTNKYKWFKNGVEITGAISADFLIEKTVVADSGNYICLISNNLVPNLILESYPITVVVEPSNGIGTISKSKDNDYILEQNIPNPFNQYTTIRYRLEQNSKVDLKIINLQGEEIKILYSGQQSSGYQEEVWDAKNNAGFRVKNGVYLVVLKVGNGIFKRKIIFSK